jgi:hypothetical protein
VGADPRQINTSVCAELVRQDGGVEHAAYIRSTVAATTGS